MKPRLVVLTEIIAPYRIPIFNALAEHECIDPHVIFLSETDPSLREWHIHKEEIRFSYEVLPSFRKRVVKYNVLVNCGLGQALRNAKPDSILCGGYNYIASWQAAYWARRARIPFLMWVESNAYDDRRRHAFVEYLKKRMLDHCNGFVVPGRMSAQYVASFGTNPERIFLAPNAVDNEFFARTAKLVRDDSVAYRQANHLPERYFLFAGRLVFAKGVFDLLEAYASLPAAVRMQYGLVFAGSGSAESDLRRRAKDISPGTVCFAGFAQRQELAILYSLADILVFPTHTDTWGLVVNEAMVCGLPIICTNVAGCAGDLVDDGGNGRVIPPKDVPQLASAMEALARDPELRSQMSIKTRTRISSFSPAAWAAGVANAVHAVTGVPHG
jgi:glycosyltransferase involved in cell wall biosynthesis